MFTFFSISITYRMDSHPVILYLLKRRKVSYLNDLYSRDQLLKVPPKQENAQLLPLAVTLRLLYCYFLVTQKAIAYQR